MTATVIMTIADKVREGASFETACTLAGVSRASGHAWLAIARRLSEAAGGDPGRAGSVQDQGMAWHPERAVSGLSGRYRKGARGG